MLDRPTPPDRALHDAPFLRDDGQRCEDLAARLLLEHPMCQTCPHTPPCPSADASDHDAARVVSTHPEQGWSLLCNGVVAFEDTGELLPDGRTIAPHRPLCRVWSAA